MQEIITALVASAVSIIAAFTTLIISRITANKTQSEIKQLKEIINSDDGHYYITCPYCGKNIMLKSVDIKNDEVNINGSSNR